jgi:NADH-quinone oxidoreductase subunit G
VKKDLLGETDVSSKLKNGVGRIAVSLNPGTKGLQRVADIPIHFADPLVRRAESLQKSKDAQAPVAGMNAATLVSLKVSAGDSVRVRLGAGEAMLLAALDETVAAGCVRVSGAHASTAMLGALNGEITVERV